MDRPSVLKNDRYGQILRHHIHRRALELQTSPAENAKRDLTLELSRRVGVSPHKQKRPLLRSPKASLRLMAKSWDP